MASQTQLANATVLVNNEVVPIIPNSLKFTEGKGEQTMRAASTGGGGVVQIFADNIETSFSKVMFDIPPTVDNIENARAWKSNTNNNIVQITGQTPEGQITRTFTQAAILNDYEVALGSETNISIEFSATAAI